MKHGKIPRKDLQKLLELGDDRLKLVRLKLPWRQTKLSCQGDRYGFVALREAAKSIDRGACFVRRFDEG